MSKTSLLDKINYPTDLRKLRKGELKQLAKELREELIDVVSTTGGHLGAGLGVVELTIALHYVFVHQKTSWFGMLGTKLILIK